MNKLYFQHRNIGSDPDTNKYYFSSIEELINQVEVLKNTENMCDHIRWSVSKMSKDNQYALMSEFWDIEKRGTEIPLKCKGWFVCGYIYTDDVDDSIYNLFPEFKADYTNHFIERKYIKPDDFSKLSELEKEMFNKDDGIILNKQI